MYGVIYKAENIITNKIYIGATTRSLEQRKNRHIYLSKNNTGCRKLSSALCKWGSNNFKWEILEECKGRMELDHAESNWINKFNSVDSGYNLYYGGNLASEESRKKMSESKMGHKVSEETRKKLSEAGKGRILSEEHKKKISKSGKGLKRSEETRKKMSIASTGKQHSDETKKKIGKAGVGRIPWNKGKTGIYSNETKRKMGEDKKGKPAWNKGLKGVQVAWNKGLTKETDFRVAKISKSLTGIKRSEETKNKVSESLINYYKEKSL